LAVHGVGSPTRFFWTKGEIALAFKRLRELPKAAGGAKKKMGRPSKESKAQAPDFSGQSRDDAAAMLGVSTHEARDLETVFTTPGVPEELKAAVNRGEVAPTPAAKAVRAKARLVSASLPVTNACISAAFSCRRGRFKHASFGMARARK
jgi:hypothetical protein